MMTDPTDAYEEYRVLLARQEAKRLRRRLLTPDTPGTSNAPDTPYASNTPSTPGALGTTRASNASGTADAQPLHAADPGHHGADDQRLITESLALVTPFPGLIADLYAAMFERHPYLRGLFPESMAFQQAHLERAFRFLIDRLDRPDEVTAFCTRLGRDHRKLGVRPVHYDVFEAALVEALRRRAGTWWRADTEEAWRRMLRRAVTAMVRGAEAALAERPFWDVTVTGRDERGPDLAVLRVAPAEPYPYRAGQYALLQSPRLARAWRPFSLACAPRADGELEFHVRRTGPGGVSDALVTRTRVGDPLRLGPAQGAMTLQEGDRDHDAVVVARGTGWAGAKALLQDLARRRVPGRVARLFLAARTREELYDLDAVAEWEARAPWLRVVPVLGAAAEGDALADAVARHAEWPPSGPVFVSGPPALAATVRGLCARGLPADHLRHDLAAAPATTPDTPDRASVPGGAAA